MSPRVRASIFIVLTLAWWGLAAMSAAAGNWIVALIDFVAGAVTAAFAYRATHPRTPAAGQPSRTREVKPLRAPRPPK